MEYTDPATGRGALFAFRGANDETSYAFRMRGLDANARYRVWPADHAAMAQVFSGLSLMQDGITVQLESRNSSEIILFQRAP